MKFIEYKPKPAAYVHKRKVNCVTLAFYLLRNKSISMRLSIPLELSEALDIKKGDRVQLSYAKENNRIYFIKKCINEEPGYKLSSNKSNSANFVTVSWKLFVPNTSEFQTISVKSELKDGGLIIYSDQEIQHD